MLSNIRIVLVGTTHPGNIGAAARAMKNMCLERLVLVAPKIYPHADATARASGADDLLANVEVCATLDEALEGCRLVVGSSARRRSVDWPELDPRTCAARLAAESESGPVALIFGREHSGLTNEELDRCHYLVHIPTNAEYRSLNLGAAVQVLAYEIYLAHLAGDEDVEKESRDLATAEMMEGFHRHLAETLEEIGFTDHRQSQKL
ncbi:MAG TPA: RNA methyltransferase, partial [Chromatiales bacterium]|nr:RNA methyltransferase [Chromatiales bacterium]